MTRYLLCGIMVLLFTSCKKTKNVSTECSSAIYGFGVPKDANSYFAAGSFGTINASAASLTSFATFPAATRGIGAFNSSDNCYYMYLDNLYKIGQDGKTMVLETTDSVQFNALVYNGHNNKFYASGQSLLEIEVNGNKYTARTAANFVHKSLYQNSITVDDNGDVYYITNKVDSISHPYHTYYIEKYHPGSSSPTVIAMDTFSLGVYYLVGLRFNKNDNMLYAIRERSNPAAIEFVKIDPSGGLITKISNPAISAFLDEYDYSACIDPCTNRYILAYYYLGGPSFLDQIDFNGTVVQHSEINQVFLGLNVK